MRPTLSERFQTTPRSIQTDLIKIVNVPIAMTVGCSTIISEFNYL